MKKPILLSSSDWHTATSIWGDRPNITGDAEYGLRQVVDIAIELGVPVVAAGDLLDQKQNFSAVAVWLRKQIQRLADEKLHLFYIQGQHERQPTPWLSALHSWPTHLASRERSFDVAPGASGITICGIDWTPRLQLAEKLDKVSDGINILVMHQVCRELMGDIVVPELGFEMLPPVSLVLLGDYHRTVAKRGACRTGAPITVLSSGSTHMRSIDEEPHKAVFIVFDDLSFEVRPLNSRPYLAYALNNEDELDRVIPLIKDQLQSETALAAVSLPEQLRTPLIRVRYPEGLPNAYSRLKAAVGDLGHLFTKVELPQRDAEQNDAVDQAADAFAKQGLVGCLPLVLNEVEDPDAFRICQRLLTTVPEEAAAAAGVIKELRAEFGLT